MHQYRMPQKASQNARLYIHLVVTGLEIFGLTATSGDCLSPEYKLIFQFPLPMPPEIKPLE
jgi:hypothetical protein